MLSSLPIEILKLILIHLSENTANLKSCALVCRTWLPDVRRLLFHSLTIFTSSDYSKISSILRKSPEIRPCIQYLDLKVVHGSDRWQRAHRKTVLTFIRNHVPQSLESFTLQLLGLRHGPDQDLISALTTYTAKLRCLKTFTAQVFLLRPNTHKFPWICEILSALPSSIQEIRIEIDALGLNLLVGEYHIWQWDKIDWAGIDRTIELSKYPCLRRVNIHVIVYWDYSTELKEWAEAQLSEMALFKNGMLDITFGEMKVDLDLLLRVISPPRRRRRFRIPDFNCLTQ